MITINIAHLLWIVPLCVMVGVILAALIAASHVDDD